MALEARNFLVVITGPTAVGKTELCIEIARQYGTEIISADSRQFYKELSIGTAKPTQEEFKGVKHHFIDFLSIDQEFSAGKFESAVLELLPELFKKNQIVIMTGGSGLYIQAVCQGMNDIPDVDLKFRTELYEELEIHGLQPLLEELFIKDPGYYNLVDKENPQRIIRALEVCRGTGEPYSVYRTDQKVDRDFHTIKIGLNRARDELFERINVRMDQMIDDGLFAEAKQFEGMRYLNALKTVGYKEVFGYLDGEYDMNEAVRLLKRNTRRYAKRQLTWFKKDPDFVWFHPDEIDKIIEHIRKSTE